MLVFDGFGNYDPFTITAVNAGTLDLSVNRSSNAMTTTYPAGSKVVEVRSRTYYLKTDAAGKTSQLMRYDGTSSRTCQSSTTSSDSNSTTTGNRSRRR